MDGKPKVATDRVYEDFEPTSQWVPEPAYDTLIVKLPGFKKQQLKVQVTTSRKTRVMGETPIGSGNKWSRFRKEFPIPENYDINEITARFDDGTLYIKHPKIITSAELPPQQEVKPPVEKTPEPRQDPTTDHQPQTTHKINNDIQKQATTQEQVPQLMDDDHQKSSTSPIKPTSEPQRQQNNGDDQEKAKTHQESLPPKEKSSTTNDGFAKDGDVLKTTSEKKQENLGDSSVQDDAKTGNVEGKYWQKNYKQQLLGGLVLELKHPRKWMSLVVAVLLVLVLGLYARNAVRSIGKSEN